MQELRTTASLVDYATLEGGRSISAVLPRSRIAAALHGADSAQLWFELGREDDEETRRLTLEVASVDVEEMLRLSAGDEVVLALDGDAVRLLDDPDVEAHGMRGALAIAVTTAAIVAPASVAVAPQTATRAQVTSVAAKTQINKSLVVKAGGVRIMRGGLAR